MIQFKILCRQKLNWASTPIKIKIKILLRLLFRLFYRHKIYIKKKAFQQRKNIFLSGFNSCWATTKWGYAWTGRMALVSLQKKKKKKIQLPWPENSREKNTYNSVRLVALKRKEECCPQCPASITHLHFLGPRVSSGIFWYPLVSSLRAMCIFASTNEMGRSPHVLCLCGCAVSSLATEQDILGI